jgi:tetratricopeptide (TPR) repeat protein
VTLGRALIELGQLDEAQQELGIVLKSAPENLAAIRGIADIHHKRGALPEALEFYRTALGLARNDPDLEQTVSDLTKQLGPARRPEPKDGLSLDDMHRELKARAASAPSDAAASSKAAARVPQPASPPAPAPAKAITPLPPPAKPVSQVPPTPTKPVLQAPPTPAKPVLQTPPTPAKPVLQTPPTPAKPVLQPPPTAAPVVTPPAAMPAAPPAVARPVSAPVVTPASPSITGTVRPDDGRSLRTIVALERFLDAIHAARAHGTA